MFKWIAKKPAESRKQYLKYGFAITECQYFTCPRCREILNAGPSYQPAYCSECGQKLDFRDVAWEEERDLGIAMDERSREWDFLRRDTA